MRAMAAWNDSVATLRLIGGHPALDLANTVVARSERGGPDRLASYGALLDWALRVGLLDAAETERLRAAAATDPDGAARALSRAKTLREAIHALFSALAAGRDPPAEPLAALGETAARAQGRRRLVRRPGGGFAWTWDTGGDLDAVTLRAALAAAELLTGGEAQVRRVKECPGRHCGWLFLDTSRGGRRLWCSEEDCGTPMRVARHRARLRGRAPLPG